ncbi:MAG TPA: FliG C-terminal domain-containing protein [Candidatus Binataceae bacterium]|nr:FliG C-terminal domain-containing protein [Candidatus Binataceae bacterium]
MALQSESSARSNKAALFAMTLNKDVLAKVLKHLNEVELANLTQAYEQEAAGKPDETSLIGVGREFLELAAGGAGGHFKEALVLAVGEEGASQILRQDPWHALAKRVTPATLAALLKDERSETIGIVLAKLPSAYSSDLFALLPEESRAKSIERLTRSGSIAAAAADALAAALEESLNSGVGAGAGDQQAGVKAAATMLNRLDSEAALAIVEQLRATEPACAAALEREMFHFEDLLKLEVRVLERILGEVPTEKLTIALKGMAPEQRDLIFSGLTDQVKQMVTQGLDDSGSVAATEVRAARREISTLALNMNRDGKVRLRADEQEMVA